MKNFFKNALDFFKLILISPKAIHFFWLLINIVSLPASYMMLASKTLSEGGIAGLVLIGEMVLWLFWIVNGVGIHFTQTEWRKKNQVWILSGRKSNKTTRVKSKVILRKRPAASASDGISEEGATTEERHPTQGVAFKDHQPMRGTPHKVVQRNGDDSIITPKHTDGPLMEDRRG